MLPRDLMARASAEDIAELLAYYVLRERDREEEQLRAALPPGAPVTLTGTTKRAP